MIFIYIAVIFIPRKDGDNYHSLQDISYYIKMFIKVNVIVVVVLTFTTIALKAIENRTYIKPTLDDVVVNAYLISTIALV